MVLYWDELCARSKAIFATSPLVLGNKIYIGMPRSACCKATQWMRKPGFLGVWTGIPTGAFFSACASWDSWCGRAACPGIGGVLRFGRHRVPELAGFSGAVWLLSGNPQPSRCQRLCNRGTSTILGRQTGTWRETRRFWDGHPAKPGNLAKSETPPGPAALLDSATW